jgi:hypothetical protein
VRATEEVKTRDLGKYALEQPTTEAEGRCTAKSLQPVLQRLISMDAYYFNYGFKYWTESDRGRLRLTLHPTIYTAPNGFDDPDLIYFKCDDYSYDPDSVDRCGLDTDWQFRRLGDDDPRWNNIRQLDVRFNLGTSYLKVEFVWICTDKSGPDHPLVPPLVCIFWLETSAH